MDLYPVCHSCHFIQLSISLYVFRSVYGFVPCLSFLSLYSTLYFFICFQECVWICTLFVILVTLFNSLFLYMFSRVRLDLYLVNHSCHFNQLSISLYIFRSASGFVPCLSFLSLYSTLYFFICFQECVWICTL